MRITYRLNYVTDLHPHLSHILFSIFPLIYYIRNRIFPFLAFYSRCCAGDKPTSLFIYGHLYIALDDPSSNLSGNVHGSEYKGINS